MIRTACSESPGFLGFLIEPPGVYGTLHYFPVISLEVRLCWLSFAVPTDFDVTNPTR